MGDIQVRAVDERLIAAAKERAEREGMSLSAYIRELIAHDLAAEVARRQMTELLTEIEHDPDRPMVAREDTADALASVRDALSAG